VFRRRTFGGIGNSGYDARPANVRERCSVSSCTRRPSGQTDQEIRERQECHPAGRVPVYMMEAILEDFWAQAHIMFPSG